uniref:Tetratricopeptide repeat protein n=1 Tax=Gongylonema pulchrum TaxID=637853 RepID=A0A183EC56_9BILA
LSNFEHRIDYADFENRAFFLLLHRYMRNLRDRCCYTTALNIAKLIYRLDPVQDPMAIMLTIDTIALQAGEYDYLILLYDTLKMIGDSDYPYYCVDNTRLNVKNVVNFKSEKRKRNYVGTPQNIKRHAYLWEVMQNADWILTDPAPPSDGRCGYARPVRGRNQPSFFLTAFLDSIWPSYTPNQVNVGLINSNRNSSDDIAHRYNIIETASANLKYKGEKKTM